MMEQENNFEEFENTPTSKIYKEKAVLVATFLGGPIVSGYLFSENFKALGLESKVKKTWLITIIVTIIIFFVAIFIADNVKIPNQLLPITYSAIAYGVFTKYQAEGVKNPLARHITSNLVHFCKVYLL